jgi:small neutral amino acid transporter SnatA (MarC family)
MSIIYKFLGSEITLSATANTVGNATLVRLVHANTSAAAHTITQKYANGTTKAVFTMVYPTGDFAIQKLPDDTLTVDSGSDVKAVSIAFTN